MKLECLFAAAAPAAKSGGFVDMLKGGQLPFNWFDIAVVVILFVGFTRGRKHGMSVEMMYMIQWIAMIFGAAFLYQRGGNWLADVSPISHLSAFVIAYITVAIVIRIVFLIFRKLVGGKLLGSNLFGAAEYYLGMGAGIVRFACIIMLFLALINARFYSDAEIKATAKYNADLYGSNFFPNLQEVQMQLFQKSFIGPVIKKHLPGLLIKPTPQEDVQVRRPGEFKW